MRGPKQERNFSSTRKIFFDKEKYFLEEKIKSRKNFRAERNIFSKKIKIFLEEKNIFPKKIFLVHRNYAQKGPNWAKYRPK